MKQKEHRKRMKRNYLATIFILIVFYPVILLADNQYMRAHFIDVGQGDATLLEFPCGAVLIDAGGKDKKTDRKLIEHLTKFFKRRTDLKNILNSVIITHTHIDHNRALTKIITDANITVLNYVHNGILEGSGSYSAKWMSTESSKYDIKSQTVKGSDITALSHRNGLTNTIIDPIKCKNIDPQIRILSGQIEENPGRAEGTFKNGNNQSLVIRIDFGKISFLFPGDLETDAQETLVEYYEETNTLDVDVYHASHHGSYNGTTNSIVQATTPRIAILSMSKWNDRRPHTAWAYGHPRNTAVTKLENGTSRRRHKCKKVHIAEKTKKFKRVRMCKALYATGWDGTTIIHARSDGRLIVKRER